MSTYLPTLSSLVLEWSWSTVWCVSENGYNANPRRRKTGSQIRLAPRTMVEWSWEHYIFTVIYFLIFIMPPMSCVTFYFTLHTLHFSPDLSPISLLLLFFLSLSFSLSCSLRFFFPPIRNMSSHWMAAPSNRLSFLFLFVLFSSITTTTTTTFAKAHVFRTPTRISSASNWRLNYTERRNAIERDGEKH